MKSLMNLREQSAARPLLADDIVEFHAARLLLLLHYCGVKNRISGLTKLAKLDFFVRYPTFFAAACAHLNTTYQGVLAGVESSMVRYHYGPWDQRYYHVLGYLEARRLISVERSGKAFNFSLTPLGLTYANRLAEDESFAEIVAQMAQVGTVLGKNSGTALKNLVYELFGEEVAEREMGEVIVP